MNNVPARQRCLAFDLARKCQLPFVMDDSYFWTLVLSLNCYLFFRKNGSYSWQQENWSRENQRIQREEWASCKAECFEIPSENCPEKGNWQWFWQGIQRKTSWQKKKISGNESLFGPIHHIRHICHAGTLYKNRFLSISVAFKVYAFTVNHNNGLVYHIYSGW